jgi:hypothetical protein
MTLGQYLQAARLLRWEWRVHDCSAWVAKWIGCPLPKYATEDEAAQVVADAGGLVCAFQIWAGPFLDPLDRDWREGDVGVIEVSTLAAYETAQDDDPAIDHVPLRVQVGAIFTGRRWAFVPHSGGIAAVTTSPIAAWRIKCRSC